MHRFRHLFIGVWVLAGLGMAATAQQPDRTLSVPEFLAISGSWLTLQRQVGERVRREAPDPEARQFAMDSGGRLNALAAKIASFAASKNSAVPDALLLQHRAVLEALESLAGEELSRRYGEMQEQAWDQAVRFTQLAAERGNDPDLKAFAAGLKPDCEENLARARAAMALLAPPREAPARRPAPP